VWRISETLRGRKGSEWYSRAFEAAEEVDSAAVHNEVDALEVELAGIRVRMRTHLKELGFDA
jgi:type I restriction enzyme M protein